MTGVDHLLIAVDFDNPKTLSGLQAALGTEVFTAAHLTLVSDDTAWIKSQLEELQSFGVTAVSLSAGVKDPSVEQALASARDHVAHLGLDLVWDLPAPYSRRNPIDLELEEPSRGPGRAWLYIEPDGDVLPGQGVDTILGNMLRDDWDRIWKNAHSRG
jgi:MoaA/NifB/PqqE/SkfB family radical SAM enzyme